MSEFVIAALPVAGGDLALSPLPQTEADLAQVAAWGPRIVLSMTEVAETPMLLHAQLAAAGMQVLHVPTPDFAVPATDDAWHEAAPVIQAALGRGERVLVHCRGGCGRSGMAVLRIMIAAGERADAALARLRDVRPCAVETEAQLIWAKRA